MPTGIEQSVVTPAAFAVRGGAGEAGQPRERTAVAPAENASSESIQGTQERALLRAPDAGTENRSAGNSPAELQERPPANDALAQNGVGGSLDVIV